MAPPPPDSLRAVLDSVFGAPAYQWTEPRDARSLLAHWFAVVGDWFRRLEAANPLVYRLALGALVVGLLAIVAHALWLMYRTVGHEPSAVPDSGLPAPFVRDMAWCRRESARLATTGRYADAIRLDFLALVLALDTRQVVRFHPSKTPSEYARELEAAPERLALFRELVHRVHGYAFARWPCGPEEYAEWRARTDPDVYAPAH